jgi:hypothetical protein
MIATRISFEQLFVMHIMARESSAVTFRFANFGNNVWRAPTTPTATRFS